MYEVVKQAAILILGGAVLQCNNVSAGNGKVIDWNIVKSGAEIPCHPDAFGVAHLFVSMVGVDAAKAYLAEKGAS